MARADAKKGGQGAAEAPGVRLEAGEASPLPSPVAGLALLAGVAAVAAGLFFRFLSLHQPGPGWVSLFAGLALLFVGTRHLPGLRERTALRRRRSDLARLARAVRRGLRRQEKGLGSDAREQLAAALARSQQALTGADGVELEAAARQLDEAAERFLVRKSATREYVEQIGGAIVIALAVRAFAYEPFKIPSGSMQPTLLVGDHLFVNKFVYGLRIPFTVRKVWPQVPGRGDIVVFNRPGEERGDDIIKRVVGLPGDVVEVRNRRVTVNGLPLETSPLGIVRLNVAGDSEQVTRDGPFFSYDAFEERVGKVSHVALARAGVPPRDPGSEGRWEVQPRHVFVMGDNRDNSADSRFGPEVDGFGQIPLEHIKGRADVIWLSLGGPYGVRFDRMFTPIH